MEQYSSALLASLFATDSIAIPTAGVSNFKENLLSGSSLVDMNGNVILETMPSAAGGETVTFSNGETAHITHNGYGSETIDFAGTTNDIVGRPSIFESETFTQNGEHIGTMEPNFMGNGFDFTSSTGETLMSSSTNVFGNTQVEFSTPLIDPGMGAQSFDLHNSFSDIEAVSSQFSAADLGSATDVIDGLDIFGLF